LTPIWTARRFEEEKPRDKRGFVTACFFVVPLFLALEVAVSVANLLDFEGDGSEAALLRSLVGKIATTTKSNKQQPNPSYNSTTGRE
jgi:hypothetical protein